MHNTEFVAWLIGYLLLRRCKTEAQQKAGWEDTEKRIIRSHINLTNEVDQGSLTIVNSWIFNDIENMENTETASSLVLRDFKRKPIISGSEVAFFLQGFFEISGGNKDKHIVSLNKAQAELIMNEMERNVDGLSPDVLQFYWTLRKFRTSDDSELDTTEIQQQLNALFHHVIDNSYGHTDAQKAELQIVHDSYKTMNQALNQAPNNDLDQNMSSVARC